MDTNTSSLVLTLLNYIINLLQVVQNNGKGIPPLERIHLPVLSPSLRDSKISHRTSVVNKQPNPAALPKLSSSNAFSGDFNALHDYVDHHISKIKGTSSTSQKIENGREISADDPGLVPYDIKEAVEAAMAAFKGPAVPPPIPSDYWRSSK